MVETHFLSRFSHPWRNRVPRKSELVVRQKKWKGWQKIKIAHKDERSAARVRATDEGEGAACEVYLNYPPLKSPRHLSSHKSPAQELKKSAKEITNSKRHAALNVRRLPPTPQECQRIITLPSLIAAQRSVRAARNIARLSFAFRFLFN